MIFIPLFKNASSRILLIIILGENFIEEKISFDGKKVICVPVSFDFPLILSGATETPSLNSM